MLATWSRNTVTKFLSGGYTAVSSENREAPFLNTKYANFGLASMVPVTACN